MKNVTIYSTPTCHFCQMAKTFFKENNISYTEHNVAEDAEKRQEMVEKSGQMGVPVIFVDDPKDGHSEMLIGFDEGRISGLLGIS